MENLKLIALDAEDLGVLSVHLQDAVARVGDLAYLPSEHRFAAILNRFDWAKSAASAGRRKSRYERRRAGLRFERVRGAQLQGIDLRSKDAVLSLLAIQYEQRTADDPAGLITLVFAGNAAIRLDVECIEAELKDLGGAWRARAKPDHPDSDGNPSSGA
jgi:hypothetical protein